MSDAPAPRRGLHWDGTISAGHVLTAVAMGLGLITWGMRLEARVDHQDERTKMQHDRLLVIERGVEDRDKLNAAARERLASMEAKQNAVLDLLTRVDRQVERIVSAPPNGGRL